MTNRRGVPQEMLSDNGTAANKELCELCKDPRVKAATADKGIKWIFNPPYAPHFGGIFDIIHDRWLISQPVLRITFHLHPSIFYIVKLKGNLLQKH